MKIRRRRFCFFQLEDRLLPDIAQFLRGEMVLRNESVLELLCPISGERIALSAQEMRALCAVRADDWMDVDALAGDGDPDRQVLQSLVDRGALLSDCELPGQKALREGEQQLQAIGWHGLTAVYHAFSRWTGVVGRDAFNEHTGTGEQRRLAAHVAAHGQPPDHFTRRADRLHTQPLAVHALQGQLFETLQARRTTRAFLQEQLLPLQDLEKVLHVVFGAQGVRRLAPGITAVKKTSASGGGLHPIDAYVLVARVDGLQSGLYHYETGAHALSLMRALSAAEVFELGTRFEAGQSYLAEAHVLVIHVARFRRHFWKYLDHMKAYKAVLMDAAHLSQTLYLVATALGLGAFFTAAINDGDVGAYLGLDPLEQGAIAISGFGLADPDRTAMEFHPDPYTPSAHAAE